jgi:hypothetical protein
VQIAQESLGQNTKSYCKGRDDWENKVNVSEIIAGKRKDWFEEPDSKKELLSIQPALKRKSVPKPALPIKKSAALLCHELFGDTDTDSESDVGNSTMPVAVAARAPKVQVENISGGRKLRLWSNHFNMELDL